MIKASSFHAAFSAARSKAERDAARDLPKWHKKIHRAIRRGQRSVDNRPLFFYLVDNGNPDYVSALQRLMPREFLVRQGYTAPDDGGQTITVVSW